MSEIICHHHDFESNVSVFRLTNNEHPNAIPTGFNAEVRIRCIHCKQEFEFIGLPYGMSPAYPTMSADNKEARLPIKPCTNI